MKETGNMSVFSFYRVLRRAKSVIRGFAATLGTVLILVVPLTARAGPLIPAAAQGSPLLHISPAWGTGDHVNLVYVANAAANSITVYLANAAGNTPPLFTIGGPNTQLDHPVGLTFDEKGQLYVANAGLHSSVTIYPWYAWGNTAPIRIIAGPHTQLGADANNYVSGAIAIDERYGRLFVGRVSTEQSPLGNNVLVFSSVAAGDAYPITSIGQRNILVPHTVNGLNRAAGIVPDSRGYLLIANDGTGCCHGSDGWTYYQRSNLASLTVNPLSFNFYANAGLAQVAIDPATDSIVSAYGGQIQVWTPLVTGGAFGPGPGPLPTLTFNAYGPLAVADGTVWCVASHSQVDRFTRSSPNPAAVLTGPRTQLNGAAGIAIRQITLQL